jgi:hypothetical protein
MTAITGENLWAWPGTHLRFGQYLAERARTPSPRSSTSSVTNGHVISPDGDF